MNLIQQVKKISETCYILNTDICNYYYYNTTCSMLHRVGLPAIEYHNGEHHYYFLGKLHNETGPAIIKGNLRRYFLNGKEFSKTEFEKKMGITNEEVLP